MGCRIGASGGVSVPSVWDVVRDDEVLGEGTRSVKRVWNASTLDETGVSIPSVGAEARDDGLLGKATRSVKRDGKASELGQYICSDTEEL